MAYSSIVSADEVEADAWCCTEIHEDGRFTYRWDVKNISKYPLKKGEYGDSSPFLGYGRKWCLRLYPNGRNGSPCGDVEHWSLFLVLLSGRAVSAIFTVSLLNYRNEKEVVLNYSSPQKFLCGPTVNSEDCCKGTDTYSYETNIAKCAIFTDCLKVLCEVVIATFPHHTSGRMKLGSHIDNLSNDLGQLLLHNREHSDVILRMNEQELHAHRAILAARSPVFSAMFKHETKEKKQNRIVINDLSYDTVAQMLRFIYTGELVDLSVMARGETPPRRAGMTLAAELLKAAHKYQLESLQSLCEDALSTNVNVEMAAEIFILADFYSSVDLKQKTAEYIKRNRIEVMKTEGWKYLLRVIEALLE